ncbi:MAG: hypothetical protein HY855_16245 [Burkholderiales bacterium]|nr:hypothetical protein [Burkholderiales bacterium]
MATKILTAPHPAIEGVPLRVAPAVGAEFNRVRSFLIPKACFKFEDAHFGFDSSFVVPGGFDISPLSALLEQFPGTKASIFGHADPVGDDAYNKRLSGRRAQAVFGLLTRDVGLWEKLSGQPAGGDNWQPQADQTMRAATGLPAGTPRAKLMLAYMDQLCTVRGPTGEPVAGEDGQPKVVKLTKADFLARGAGPNGKGDVQGCSEFNPLMVFSKDEKAFLDQPENRPERNVQNQGNRRVMVLLFRAGSQVDPGKWPCPTVEEGTGGCLKRFYADGEQRRSNQEARREFKDTKDTFACRFYDRLSNSSPCEIPALPSDAFVADALLATLPSTRNAASGARPAAGSFSTSNSALDFVAPLADLMVVVQNAGEITVKAQNVQPPSRKPKVHWQVDRDPADTVAADLPGLDTTTGDTVKITPSTPGSFRLICFRDPSGDGKHQPGEEVLVLRFVIVRITPQAGATLTTQSVFTPGTNGVSTGQPGQNPMQLRADFLLEGGGANRRFGLGKVVLANVGNLLTDTFVVNYPGQAAPADTRAGTETEDPDFRTNPAAGFPAPMVDTVNVARGAEPTGGNSPNRGNTVQTILGNGPGGNGQLRRINSLDVPAFGWDGTHPTTNNPWASTQGVNGFREWILAHTTNFPRNYTALGRGDWTVTVTGTNDGAGNWVDNGSTVTGTAFTIAGFPQTADAARAQVLGRSFVREFGMIVNP